MGLTIQTWLLILLIWCWAAAFYLMISWILATCCLCFLFQSEVWPIIYFVHSCLQECEFKVALLYCNRSIVTGIFLKGTSTTHLWSINHYSAISLIREAYRTFAGIYLVYSNTLRLQCYLSILTTAPINANNHSRKSWGRSGGQDLFHLKVAPPNIIKNHAVYWTYYNHICFK